MTSIAEAARAPSARLAREAVRRDGGDRLLEALFAKVFSGLVYPQIWEDPLIDAEGLALRPGDRIAAIASGGCNVMSYLTAEPDKIVAVDLNAHHVALLKLKIAAARHLPDHRSFHAFFGLADNRENVAAFDAWIAPQLDPAELRYWAARDLFGRRRIAQFSRGFYRRGALGRFIALGHLVARLHGSRPERLLAAPDRDAQRAVFAREIAPVFSSWLVRRLTSSRASLFGLGVPPAQYEALSGGRPMADVLLQRLERLACGFDVGANYFAWQAFGRRYAPGAAASLPPYLAAANFTIVRERANRIEPLQQPLTEMLADRAGDGFDRYALLDAQDWMPDRELNRLWEQITRTARPGARVLFRTAAAPSLLPGRLAPHLLARWRYEESLSLDLTRRDRSAVYGGVHVYALKRS